MATHSSNRSNETINQPKKNHHFKFSKQRWVRLVVLFVIAIGLLVGGVFLIDAILKWRAENADITIGDTVITKENREKFAVGLKNQYSTFGEKKSDDEIKKLADDSLILNAGLEQYASKCSVSISKNDLNDTHIEWENNLIAKINAENEAYKTKLTNCLIKTKKIFVYSTVIDHYPFIAQTPEQAQILYDKTKESFINKILPKIESGKSAKEIAKTATLDLINNSENDIDWNEYNKNLSNSTEPIIVAEIRNFNAYNLPNDNFNVEYKPNVGNIENVTEKFKSLTVGKNTGVFMGANGELMVAREESETGEFNTWDDFIKNLKINNNISKIEIIKTIAGFFGSKNVEAKSVAGKCADYANSHWVPLSFQTVNSSGVAVGVSGVSVSTSQDDGCSSDSGTTSSSGYAYLYLNCMGGNNNISLGGDTSSYFVYRMYINDSHSFTNISGDNTKNISYAWTADANSKGWADIKIVVATKTNWTISGFSSVNNGGWKTGNGGSVKYVKGGRIQFKNTVSSSGNGTGKLSIAHADWYKGSSSSPTYTQGSGGWSEAKSWSNISFTDAKSLVNDDSFYFTMSSVEDIGKYVCMNISYNPTKHDNTSSGHSTPACVRIINDGITTPTPGKVSSSGAKCGTSTGGKIWVKSYKNEETTMTGSTSLTGYSKGYTNEGDVNTAYKWTTNFDKGRMDLTYTTHTAPTMSGTVIPSSSTAGTPVVSGNVGFSATANDQDNKNPDTASSNTGGICIYVPYNYKIEGKTEIDGKVYGPNQTVYSKETGEAYTPTLTITNNGPTRTRPTQWKVSTFRLPETVSVPNEVKSDNSNPCAVYSGNYKCSVPESGSGVVVNDGQAVKKWSSKQTVPDDAQLGEKICWSISAQPISSEPIKGGDGSTTDDNRWLHAAPVCITVVKKPKMQVWGGNVWATRGIKTSTTNLANGQIFGSWAEYDLISTGVITKMASASGYSKTTGATGTNGASIGRLTPRTSNTSSTFGSYPAAIPSVGILANLESRFKSTAALSSWNPALVQTDGTPTLFNISGNVEINGATFRNGQSVILFSSGTVTITDNITMDATKATTPLNTPQLIIIAKDGIKIANSVINIDAWLLTAGEVKTCNVGGIAGGVNQANCGNPLKINGPVIASKLNSWRTAGSLPNRSEPAEIYNLRLDTYQWLHAQASGHGKIFTEYTKELPPRF